MTLPAAAIWAAVVSLIGKVLFDLWTQHRLQCGIAAVLAGEIQAYIDLLRPDITPAAYRSIARKPRDDRQQRLRSFPSLPSGHPVFDEVADKIGFLGPEDAAAVSRVYNVVSGMRLLIANLAAPGFVDAPDDVHQAALEFIAWTIDTEVPIARGLICRLKTQANRPFGQPLATQLRRAGLRAPRRVFPPSDG